MQNQNHWLGLQAPVTHDRLDTFGDLRACSSFVLFPYRTEREVIEPSSVPGERSPRTSQAELLTWTQVQMMEGSLAGMWPPFRDVVT